jgi:hypothetical protein
MNCQVPYKRGISVSAMKKTRSKSIPCIHELVGPSQCPPLSSPSPSRLTHHDLNSNSSEHFFHSHRDEEFYIVHMRLGGLNKL